AHLVLLPYSGHSVPPPPPSTLFPYTTLFRSQDLQRRRFSHAGIGFFLARDAALADPGALLNPLIRGVQEFREFVVRHDALGRVRSEEHTSELQSRVDLVCRLLLERKNDSIRG